MTPYDLELILPLDLIRIECALEGDDRYTDDIVGVWRDVALSHAETHTGLILKERRQIVEPLQPVDAPGSTHRRNDAEIWADPWGLGKPRSSGVTIHRTAHMIAAAAVTVREGDRVREIPVTPGTNVVHFVEDVQTTNILQVHRGVMAPEGESFVEYLAGFPDERMIPPEVHEGATALLKHLITNRAAGADVKSGQIVGAVVSSGAQDVWASLSR